MATIKTNVGGIRLKLGTALDSQPAVKLPQAEPDAGRVGARVLAKSIADYTVKVLVDGEMLDPAVAAADLLKYGSNLEKGINTGECIVRFLFPDEGRLAMVLVWLNSQANLHVWEIAHRLPPPESFYKAHAAIQEACKICGAVILDASTPSTITTGGINPLAGDFLARWIQTELECDAAETRPRFFFHVLIPPRLWPGIMRTHFRYDHVI